MLGENPKYEIRNFKQIPNPNSQILNVKSKVSNKKSENQNGKMRFGICYLGFRISFGFRIRI